MITWMHGTEDRKTDLERKVVHRVFAGKHINYHSTTFKHTDFIYIHVFLKIHINKTIYIYIYTPGTDLQEHAHTYMYMCYIHADQQLQSCASTPIKALNLHNMMQVLNMKHTLDSQYLRPGGGRDLDSNPRRQRQQQRNNASSSSSRALDVADRALRIVEKATEKW